MADITEFPGGPTKRPRAMSGRDYYQINPLNPLRFNDQFILPFRNALRVYRGEKPYSLDGLLEEHKIEITSDEHIQEQVDRLVTEVNRQFFEALAKERPTGKLDYEDAVEFLSAPSGAANLIADIRDIEGTEDFLEIYHSDHDYAPLIAACQTLEKILTKMEAEGVDLFDEKTDMRQLVAEGFFDRRKEEMAPAIKDVAAELYKITDAHQGPETDLYTVPAIAFELRRVLSDHRMDVDRIDRLIDLKGKPAMLAGFKNNALNRPNSAFQTLSNKDLFEFNRALNMFRKGEEDDPHVTTPITDETQILPRLQSTISKVNSHFYGAAQRFWGQDPDAIITISGQYIGALNNLDGTLRQYEITLDDSSIKDDALSVLKKACEEMGAEFPKTALPRSQQETDKMLWAQLGAVFAAARDAVNESKDAVPNPFAQAGRLQKIAELVTDPENKVQDMHDALKTRSNFLGF